MKKVINMFNQPKVEQNKGDNYSTLIEQFIEPFAKDFFDFVYYEEVFEFAIHAWNFGNMKLISPHEGSNDAFKFVKDNPEINSNLLTKMIDYKISHFKEYTNFIVDYEVEKSGNLPVLTVITEEQEDFLTDMFANESMDNSEDEFEENYINRSAIIIKPLQPFLDWSTKLNPNDLDEMKETNTYLISEDIEDVEAWLKEKFDKIFTIELASCHPNKKFWPQKRNYKMFKEWFQVDLSMMIYDFEMHPVSKSL